MIEIEYVRKIFAKLASDRPDEFMDYVADNVQWTVLGTHPLAGRYTSKAAFVQATFPRLGQLFDGPPRLFTRDVLVDGDRAAVELYTDTTSKRGVPFPNEYCWICQFENGRIVAVREYLDSALVARTIEQDEVRGTL